MIRWIQGGSVRVLFEIVRSTRRVAGKCSVCGRRCVRTFSATQILNPFNTKEDGSPKTLDEIRAENEIRLETFAAQPLMHAKCKPS